MAGFDRNQVADISRNARPTSSEYAFLVTFPRDRIRTVLFFGWFVRITFLPAVLLIGFWFLTQLVEFDAVAEVQSGGVAYMAHIGGAIFGAVSARLFEDRRRLAELEGEE